MKICILCSPFFPIHHCNFCLLLFFLYLAFFSIYVRYKTKSRTIDEHSKAEEVEVFLSTARVPADVGVAFSQQHGAALKATSSQILHHLGRQQCAELKGNVPRY